MLFRKRDFPEAERALREALQLSRQLGPTDHRAIALLYHKLAAVLFEQRKLSDAVQIYAASLPKYLESWPVDLEPEIRALTEALFDHPNYAELDKLFAAILPKTVQDLPNALALLRARGTFHGRRSQFKDAADDFARVIDLSPERVHDWLCLAVLQLRIRQFRELAGICQRSVERFSRTADPGVADQVAIICLLRPGPSEELKIGVKLTDYAVQFTNHLAFRSFRLTKALAEYPDKVTSQLQLSGPKQTCRSQPLRSKGAWKQTLSSPWPIKLCGSPNWLAPPWPIVAS